VALKQMEVLTTPLTPIAVPLRSVKFIHGHSGVKT